MFCIHYVVIVSIHYVCVIFGIGESMNCVCVSCVLCLCSGWRCPCSCIGRGVYVGLVRGTVECVCVVVVVAVCIVAGCLAVVVAGVCVSLISSVKVFTCEHHIRECSHVNITCGH